jgi:hypothetical protein
MEDHFSGLKAKRLVIPHQLTKENELPIALPSWFNPEKFNLLHAGNLMKQRNPFPLIKAFQRFLGKNPQASADARLLLVGSASYHLSRLNKVEKKIQELFVSKGYVSYNLVLKLQKETSVNIILESIAKLSPFLPGKFPHCVAANKPVLLLGPEKSEVRRLLGPDYDFFAQADDINRIAVSIEKLYYKWKDNRETMLLDRNDIQTYLSTEYLNIQINNII